MYYNSYFSKNIESVYQSVLLQRILPQSSSPLGLAEINTIPDWKSCAG